MTKTVAILALLSSAAAFVPTAPLALAGGRVSAARAAPASALTMAAKDMVGAIAPLGLFDPIGFSKGSVESLNSYRESELKHGRTAMLAVFGWLVQEVGHPFYPEFSSNPLKAATELSFEGWAQIIAFTGFLEFVCSKIKTRPSYLPGDYLGAADLMDASDAGWVRYQETELSNGRLAMIAIMGMIAQAAVTGKGVLA